MRRKTLLAAAAVAAIALPVSAAVQESNAVAPSPAATQPAPQENTTNTTNTTTAIPTPSPSGPSGSRPAQSLEELEAELLGLEGYTMPAPPVEIPDHARRDPAVVGRLDPVQLGLGAAPWRGASGAFLSTLMRRMETPLASRWAHIALRNALLARTRAPRNVNPVDWAAERAWLLLRMGEADAARMLVSGVDVDQFTPKMFQVGVQSALANADPAALCPLQGGIQEVEPQIYQLVDAICAGMAGEPESASAQIETARRRGRSSPIDVALAQKVVSVGSNAGTAVTIEWEPVERLNAWRFGLATATDVVPPARLIRSAPLQVRAWQAQSPMLAPADRLESAEIATALGVFSSQALIDLHALIYDSTGPDDLADTDAWQLRLAFTGNNQEARLGAMRRLWSQAEGPLELTAVRAMLGRAASLVRPDAELQADAVNLIASMLAAGLDREAAEWARAVSQMDDEFADPAWAMLALGSPRDSGVDLSLGRINGFISRDKSPDKKRSALLVAGLAGLGHINTDTAERLSGRHGLRLGRQSRWTKLIDRAAAFGQSGTVLILAGTGLQAPSFDAIPPAHMFRTVSALRRTQQEFTARMIAAEALART